jgi:hypothetical protein
LTIGKWPALVGQFGREICLDQQTKMFYLRFKIVFSTFIVNRDQLCVPLSKIFNLVKKISRQPIYQSNKKWNDFGASIRNTFGRGKSGSPGLFNSI